MSYSTVKSKCISGAPNSAAGLRLHLVLIIVTLGLASNLANSYSPSYFPPDVSARSHGVEQSSAIKSRHSHRLLKSAPIHYLVYGTAAEPFQITSADGLSSGFITDIVDEVFEQSDIALTPVMKPIKRIKREMIQGEAKRWIAYALRSWKSEGVWGDTTFASVDLLQYHLSLGYKKVSGEVELPRLKDSGVVWIQGFRYPGANEFSDRYGFQFQRVKNHLAMLKMVEAGRTQFFMEHAPRMRHVMKQLDIDSDRYGFYSLEDQIPPTQITLLMSNDLGDEVIDFVNRRLLAMKESGRILELARRYKLVPGQSI
ncbi:MAG: hypothetical protein ACRBBW_18140 [Cellvibrionaceae bacterium]